MPSTPREKRRQMTYEDLVDRLYYDEAVGRFRFARNMPPKGKQGDLAGAWNPEKKTWQISWQGAPFSMAIAVWLWHHRVWPDCELMVQGDVSTGLWLENLKPRKELLLDPGTLDVAVLRRYMHYDPETGVAQWLASASPRGKLLVDWHSREERKHRRVNFMGRGWAKTHLIWWYMTGELPPKDLVVDHKDGNPFNNRWVNLRLATPAENAGNTQTRAHKDRIYPRGVYKDRPGVFMARAMKNGKRHRRGPFPTPEAAHEAYKALHIALHGEFSVYASRPEAEEAP